MTGTGAGNDYHLRRVLLFAVLVILCALSFLQYAGWATVYSGILGLPSRASETQEAATKARLFFWVFVVLEAVATLTIAPLFRLENFWSREVRTVARYGMGLILSLIASGLVVGLLSLITS